MSKPSKNPFEIDWSNVNLEDTMNHNLNLIDGLTFGALLLEINCNIPEINAATVREQFGKDLANRCQEAREIFEDNIDNIIAAARKERNGK
jgi:hypothetical protein